MHQYPKQILTIPQLVQSYIDAGMNVPSVDEASEAMETIGYYRLRGYCFQWYNNASKQYASGTDFRNVLKLYRFDTELSHLLFEMASSIEVSLRARLTDALLTYNDALILMDSTVFDDKTLYWKNLGAVSGEIVRSNDVFIKHNFKNHGGEIPLWAAVEVMSFGTLSKTIKNLSTGPNSAFSALSQRYKYPTPNGNQALPSKQRFSSWVQSVSVIRNMCAHNSRIYNRAISTAPELTTLDQITPKPQYTGLYEVILAMKYLRPSDAVWTQFVADLNALFTKYAGIFEYSRINFPADWANHFVI